MSDDVPGVLFIREWQGSFSILFPWFGVPSPTILICVVVGEHTIACGSWVYCLEKIFLHLL